MDEDVEISSAPAALPSQNPVVQLPEFTEMIREVFRTYLNQKSSVELHVVLLEILMCIGPSEWSLIFPDQAQGDELVKYLLSLKDAQSGACPPALRAAAIQTCAYLLSQPRFAKMEDLVNGTFQFVFDTAAEPNLILQVRNSQATKELCTYLLSSPELYKPQIDRVIQLLRVILVYANSSRDKVTANAIRALGFFLAQVDIGHLQKEIDQENQSA